MPLSSRVRSSAQSYPYWLSIFGQNTLFMTQGLSSDGQGNFYVAADLISLTGGVRDLLVVQFNKNGNAVWRKLYGNSGYNRGVSATPMVNGDVLFCGQGETGVTTDTSFLSVLSSTGDVQWQKQYSSGYLDRPREAASDANGNIYLCGATRANGTVPYQAFVAKLDSSGTILWQKTLTSATSNVEANGIAIDGVGNVYVTGYVTNSTSDVLLVKYDTNGFLQWQRTLGSFRTNVGRRVAVDSNGDICVCGYAQDTGATTLDLGLTAKYDPSGTLLWQRTLADSVDVFLTGMDTDANANIYVSGYKVVPGTSQSEVMAAKYNSSGFLQWQRLFRAGGTEYAGGIAIDSNGEMGFSLWGNPFGTTNDYRIVLAKLPADGSLTGVYSQFTYEPSTFVDALGTLAGSIPTLTDAAHTLTEIPSTLGVYSLNTLRTIIPIG